MDNYIAVIQELYMSGRFYTHQSLPVECSACGVDGAAFRHGEHAFDDRANTCASSSDHHYWYSARLLIHLPPKRVPWQQLCRTLDLFAAPVLDFDALHGWRSRMTSTSLASLLP